MKYTDLDLRELLTLGEGLIDFAGERSLIISTNALGILRKEIHYLLGPLTTKGVFLRMGFAHGWRTAERLKDGFPWEDMDQWRKAGGRLHALQGHVVVEVPPWSGVEQQPFAHSIWRDSYEAEQHLRLIGMGEEPVCWTLSGFVSGYLSYVNGRRVLAMERHCRGQGDSVCFMEARFEEEWGEAANTVVPLLDSPCLAQGLEKAANALKKVEEELVKKRKAKDSWLEEERLVARAPATKRCFQLAQQVAQVDSTVLITGESGCGKERIAQLIHGQSSRMGGPFLAVNCGAITESLLESELFGHVRGAFTGATQDRIGLFEAARGGTLFLDEIGELPLSMQVKLLRVLQERQIRRVGDNRAREVDVRLLAATNRDLVEEVEVGRFREDLYYRLKVIHLPIPPLRERKEDILPLARFFLQSLLGRFKKTAPQNLSPSAADLLLRYGWPGNVRELENAIEHAVVLAQGERIGIEDLPPELRGDAPVAMGSTLLADVEKQHILTVLADHQGNRTHAAKALGIGSATLFRKLKQYGAAESMT